MAFLATLLEQLLAAAAFASIDGAENLLRASVAGAAVCSVCSMRMQAAMSTELRYRASGRQRRAHGADISGTIAPTPSASPTLRASGCDTEPLYCTQSNFQMFHRYG